VNIEKINKIVKVDFKEGLKKILPEIFEDNKINFEKLKALLSGEIIEKEDDRFYFNWAGKSNIFKFIQAPAYGTLKPDKERSIDFDKTENIAIIGENLETLKLLLKPYFGKIKMIYIDPPYNTGKDFIYRDNFKEPVRDYLEKTGQVDSEGNKLTTNTEASGRYHSDWLNFIYPRLFLAKNLLRDDGVIFVSIDDHEVHHLRMIMDEIFGEENFVANICAITNRGGRDYGGIARTHEYILVYQKTENAILSDVPKGENYKFPFYDSLGGFEIRELRNRNIRFNVNNRPNLLYPFYADLDICDKNGFYQISLERNSKYCIEILPKISQEVQTVWRWGKEKAKLNLNINLVAKRMENGGFQIIEKYRKSTKMLRSVLDNKEIVNEVGTEILKDIFSDVGSVYDYPKSPYLIKTLLQIGTDSEGIMLDFFAGSGTTGHAVWDLNKEDGGNRKFILVQLDEEVQDEKIKKEFPTVADICIERLRKVSEKYKREITSTLPRNDEKDNTHDFGFKVFRLDKSNFNLKDEFEIKAGEDIEELKRKYLEWLGIWIDEPLVGGWQKIDVIYEIILKEGLNLNSKIEEVRIKNNNFYYVKDAEQNLDFYISLEDKINNEAIEEIRTTKYKNKMFVFLDKALTDDDKINLTSFVRLKVI